MAKSQPESRVLCENKLGQFILAAAALGATVHPQDANLIFLLLSLFLFLALPISPQVYSNAPTPVPAPHSHIHQMPSGILSNQSKIFSQSETLKASKHNVKNL